MNEPATFRGEIPGDIVFSDEGQKADHTRMHNAYGHLMAKATHEGLKEADGRRPFVITRCSAGTQKYSTAWTGDNHSIWAHLQMAVPQLCNLSLSGMPFVGTDIAGFGIRRHTGTSPPLGGDGVLLASLPEPLLPFRRPPGALGLWQGRAGYLPLLCGAPVYVDTLLLRPVPRGGADRKADSAAAGVPL